MTRRRPLAALLLTALVLPLPAVAADRGLTVPDLEDEVMCVVCKRPLATSGGSAADDERAVIQGYIDDGLSKPQILDRLVADYGEGVLVDDKNPATAIAPVAAALVGLVSVTVLLRRRGRRGDAHSPAVAAAGVDPALPVPTAADEATSVSAADEARIDAELAELDGPTRG